MIEDGLLGPLQHPDVYEALAQKTRRHPASNRPRAVLFEGPPGCGKTTSARCASCAASHLAMGMQTYPSRYGPSSIGTLTFHGSY